MVSADTASQTAEEPHPTGSFDITKLSFRQYGDPASPAVLILHGWGSNAAIMDPMARDLGRGYNVYNLDLPGHGETPAPTTAIGVPEHGELVANFIRTTIGKPVILIGHSNGGRIGLYLAGGTDPDNLIEKLVLISPSGIKPKRGPGYYVRSWTAKTLKAPFVILPEPLRSHGLRWVRGTFVWQLLGSSDYKSATGVMRDIFVRTVGFFVEDRLHNITCPVLILWGTEDTAVSEYQVNKLIGGIEHAELVRLESAGHYGFVDKPGIVSSSIKEFLGERA